MEDVQILLSLYNGEKFIIDQIDSILNQSYQSFKILIRDDGSSDGSLSLIYDYYKNHPKIEFLNDNLGNIGATLSFCELLKHSSSKYIMFSDQDDIWKKDKIEVSLLSLKKLEHSFPNEPCLVSTDAACIDSLGNIIDNSFFQSQKFNFDVINNPTKMCALNIVQGSTMIFNQYVKSFVFPIPKEQYHDKWISVIVAHYGHYFYLPIQTLLYRQHQNQVVGANAIGLCYFIKRLFPQIVLNMRMCNQLPFRISFLKVMLFKLFYSIKRL